MTDASTHAAAARLIAPYGGTLVNLTVPDEARDQWRSRAHGLPALRLTDRALCDLELLATGAFSPLDRFMASADHSRVLDEMRLAGGLVFPMPIALAIDLDSLEQVQLDRDVTLTDQRNEPLAIMTVEEIYEIDPASVAERICGTADARHPFVNEMRRSGRFNLSGRLHVFKLPGHYDFRDLRLTPAETRRRLELLDPVPAPAARPAPSGIRNVVAFQTRNPLHRAHEELTKRAIAQVDGVLLLHPVVGLTKPGDVDHYTRVRTYRALANRYYEADRILLALLPLAMRMAGPREALWHAIIRRNHGANHLIVGRDHASPGVDSTGRPFYGPYDAQTLVESFEDEVGVRVIPFNELVYLPGEDRYEDASKIAAGTVTASISGTQVRDEYLSKGRALPDWFTRREVADILADAYPPLHRHGVCIWFTGLSGAGKSMTAEAVIALLLEHGRQATLLDGDIVRTHLSQGLGFSKADRDTNIRRIGFVASEVVRHGGIAVCAAVSPYRVTRDEVRTMVGPDRFVEVFVDTPLEVCESRDTKGMYAKARRGEIKEFTGISDPYEPPASPEVTLDTVTRSVEENARFVLGHLEGRGLLGERLTPEARSPKPEA